MPAETPLEQALEFLKLPSKDGDSGLESSLFDHLANVILRILEEKPENALEVFEEVSRDVRKSSVAIPGQEPSEAVSSQGIVFVFGISPVNITKFLNSYSWPRTVLLLSNSTKFLLSSTWVLGL